MAIWEFGQEAEAVGHRSGNALCGPPFSPAPAITFRTCNVTNNPSVFEFSCMVFTADTLRGYWVCRGFPCLEDYSIS